MTSNPQWWAEFERQEAIDMTRREEAQAARQQRELFAQLAELTKRWTSFEDIPVSQQRECRDLGRKLHALGAEPLMREAYYHAHAQNRAASILAAYWDGIGEWRW